MATLTCLKGDKASSLYSDWLPWLKQVDVIYTRCLEEYDYRPFHDHEQAAVSLLVGAANRAKLLAFAECSVAKGERNGRGDLWIACSQMHYWFEFKRSAYNPFASKWGLRHSLEVATGDARKLEYVRGEIGVAAVIAATSKLKAGYREAYSEFAEEVDYAFHVGPDGSRGAYLYFKQLEY